MLTSCANCARRVYLHLNFSSETQRAAMLVPPIAHKRSCDWLRGVMSGCWTANHKWKCSSLSVPSRAKL